MLINVELPNGITVKVESDWYHSMSDHQLDEFFKNNMVNFDYHSDIQNPFDNSSLEITPIIDDINDIIIDEIDLGIDYDFSSEDY